LRRGTKFAYSMILYDMELFLPQQNCIHFKILDSPANKVHCNDQSQ
jgi:hypothetical protein